MFAKLNFYFLIRTTFRPFSRKYPWKGPPPTFTTLTRGLEYKAATDASTIFLSIFLCLFSTFLFLCLCVLFSILCLALCVTSLFLSICPSVSDLFLCLYGYLCPFPSFLLFLLLSVFYCLFSTFLFL